MKEIVVRVREDICAANQRDPEATSLIQIARTFGTVETLDSALSAEKTKNQLVLNNLTAQYEAEIAAKDAEIEALKNRSATDEELEILHAIRKKSEAEASGFKTEIATRDAQLKAIQVENENRAAAIKAMYGF